MARKSKSLPQEAKPHVSKIGKSPMTLADVNFAIRPPKFLELMCTIYGVATSPYVQHRFSAKARAKIRADQEAGGTKTKNRIRDAKDFDVLYQDAGHIAAATSDDPGGWYGIPANAIRSAMISACRVSGFKMTAAKLSVFVAADGRDADDGTPLVRIRGEPEPLESTVRNATGVVDVRLRPAFKNGWEADIIIQFDADIFTPNDVLALLIRAGRQVGIGEGRHDSKKSNGLGWGEFSVRAHTARLKLRTLDNDIAQMFAPDVDVRLINPTGKLSVVDDAEA